MNTASLLFSSLINSLVFALIRAAYNEDMSYFKQGSGNATFDKLTLWIAGSEIEHLVGYPMDIYVVREGKVLSYLQNALYDTQLPILPPEINSVSISWIGPDDTYKYSFPDFRSLDPHVMHDPLINITKWGTVPHKRETFTIGIPCTGERTGIASMYLSLDIEQSNGRAIPGSPLKLHIRKRCIAFAESKSGCEGKCKNGGTCEMGSCLCRRGYHGNYCQLASCFPACINNGTCIKPDKCVCPRGYSGERCEKVRCKSNCSQRGHCLEPNKCTCPPEYYGEHCQHVTGICEPPCQYGGTCTSDHVCACREGYSGSFCGTPSCKKSCGDNGRCVAVNTCECFRGWRGRWCHKTVNRMEKDEDYKRRKLRHARRGKREKIRRVKHMRHTDDRRRQLFL